MIITINIEKDIEIIAFGTGYNLANHTFMITVLYWTLIIKFKKQ